MGKRERERGRDSCCFAFKRNMQCKVGREREGGREGGKERDVSHSKGEHAMQSGRAQKGGCGLMESWPPFHFGMITPRHTKTHTQSQPTR